MSYSPSSKGERKKKTNKLLKRETGAPTARAPGAAGSRDKHLSERGSEPLDPPRPTHSRSQAIIKQTFRAPSRALHGRPRALFAFRCLRVRVPAPIALPGPESTPAPPGPRSPLRGSSPHAPRLLRAGRPLLGAREALSKLVAGSPGDAAARGGGEGTRGKWPRPL